MSSPLSSKSRSRRWSESCSLRFFAFTLGNLFHRFYRCWLDRVVQLSFNLGYIRNVIVGRLGRFLGLDFLFRLLRDRLFGLCVYLWLRDSFSLWLRDSFSLWLRDSLRSRRSLGLATRLWLCGGGRLSLSLRSRRGLWSFNRLSYGLLG